MQQRNATQLGGVVIALVGVVTLAIIITFVILIGRNADQTNALQATVVAQRADLTQTEVIRAATLAQQAVINAYTPTPTITTSPMATLTATVTPTPTLTPTIRPTLAPGEAGVIYSAGEAVALREADMIRAVPQSHTFALLVGDASSAIPEAEYSYLFFMPDTVLAFDRVDFRRQELALMVQSKAGGVLVNPGAVFADSAQVGFVNVSEVSGRTAREDASHSTCLLAQQTAEHVIFTCLGSGGCILDTPDRGEIALAANHQQRYSIGNRQTGEPVPLLADGRVEATLITEVEALYLTFKTDMRERTLQCLAPVGDADGDVVYFSDDECPTQRGRIEQNGCPLDATNTPSASRASASPTRVPEQTQVPPPTAVPATPVPVPTATPRPPTAVPVTATATPVPDRDGDGDGIPDDYDWCPFERGPSENNGCPWPDTDGDGVTDNLDQCDNQAGPSANNGCPWPDGDGDGVPDDVDPCPFEAGPPGGNGCPPVPDSDGDGVPDDIDACPFQAGSWWNSGCPEPPTPAPGAPPTDREG